MEKGTVHCKLPVVKALIEAGQVKATFSALSGGAAPGSGFRRHDQCCHVANAAGVVSFKEP
ncbi:MAG TPA: hypothetical protein VMK82_04515 [Steroidobacteraceae bacterium]|nr:hypothetical protein [Steroidobacteraceae bacterium]